MHASNSYSTSVPEGYLGALISADTPVTRASGSEKAASVVGSYSKPHGAVQNSGRAGVTCHVSGQGAVVLLRHVAIGSGQLVPAGRSGEFQG